MSAADRARLAAVIADRNRAQKHVWRAQVLLSADRLGTAEIMRRTDRAKLFVDRRLGQPRKKINISAVLAGQKLGIKEVDGVLKRFGDPGYETPAQDQVVWAGPMRG